MAIKPTRKRFGVIGDGKADDTTGLNNAIEAAEEAGDTVAFDPWCSYRTTRPLLVNAGCALRGRFVGTGRGGVPGSTIILDGDHDAVVIASSGVAVRGLRFAASPNAAGRGVVIGDGIGGIEVRRNTFDGLGNSAIVRAPAEAISTFLYLERNTVVFPRPNPDAYGGVLAAIDVTQSEGAFVRKNRTAGVGDGAYQYVAVTARGNAGYVTVSENHIEQAQRGINAAYVTRWTVDHNTITYAWLEGIVAIGQEFDVSHNLIEAPSQVGDGQADGMTVRCDLSTIAENRIFADVPSGNSPIHMRYGMQLSVFLLNNGSSKLAGNIIAGARLQDILDNLQDGRSGYTIAA